jgi:hypothetical protein
VWWIAGAAVCAALWVGTAVAADPEVAALDKRAAAIDAASAAPDGIRVVGGHLSRKLAISFETLQAQRAQLGVGWGDFLIAHYLARDATVAVEDVVRDFRGGKAWADIAADRHVDLARLTGEVRTSQEAIEQQSEDRGLTGAPPSSSKTGAGRSRGKGGGRRQAPQ